jgi:hypothetical protein
MFIPVPGSDFFSIPDLYTDERKEKARKKKRTKKCD